MEDGRCKLGLAGRRELVRLIEQGALIFVIPGRDTTLRVNGHAAVTAEPELLSASRRWASRRRLRSWLRPRRSSAEVSLAHQRNPELTLEEVQQRERESLAKRLD
jgi:hypothetical protein